MWSEGLLGRVFQQPMPDECEVLKVFQPHVSIAILVHTSCLPPTQVAIVSTSLLPDSSIKLILFTFGARLKQMITIIGYGGF